MGLPLVELLEPVVDRLRGVDPAGQSYPFSQRLLSLRKEAFAKLPGGAEGPTAARAAKEMARICLTHIGRVPAMVDGIRDQLASPETPAPMKLAHALCLKYLAAPRDLLPDDLPDAYGFVDDVILLWAALGLREHYIAHAPERVKVARASIRQLSMAVPRDIAAPLETALGEMQRLVQPVARLPEDTVLSMVQQIIANPAAPPPAPPKAADVPPDPPLFSIPNGTLAAEPGGGVSYRFDDGGSVTLD